MNNNLDIEDGIEQKRIKKWVAKSEYVNAYARQYYLEHTSSIECPRCKCTVVSNKLQRHQGTKKCMKRTIQLLKDHLFEQEMVLQNQAN